MAPALQMIPDAPTRHAFGASIILAPRALPSLPRSPASRAGSPVVQLDWAESGPPGDTCWHHDWTDGSDVLLSMSRHDGGYWLRVPNYADFLVQLQPCSVKVSLGRYLQDAATLEHLLVDQILPRVLAQLGGTMVHASTVRIGQRHLLFTGPSGWGKSTLAGLLHQQGHRILSDDCVQLIMGADGRFRAIPTYPSLRLNEDSLDALFPDQAATAPVASYSEKRRIPMPAAGTDTPALVDAIYLLGDPEHADDAVRMAPIPPAQTCLALIKHSFRLDLADRAASALHLQRCSEIARSVPGFRLDYPRDHARRDALTAALLDHIASLPNPEEKTDLP